MIGDISFYKWLKIPYTMKYSFKNTPVAQWIERCPPEAKA